MLSFTLLGSETSIGSSFQLGVTRQVVLHSTSRSAKAGRQPPAYRQQGRTTGKAIDRRKTMSVCRCTSVWYKQTLLFLGSMFPAQWRVSPASLLEQLERIWTWPLEGWLKYLSPLLKSHPDCCPQMRSALPTLTANFQYNYNWTRAQLHTCTSHLSRAHMELKVSSGLQKKQGLLEATVLPKMQLVET